MKPIDFVPKPHPANVDVRDIPTGKELGAMLDAGEIDALISADNPKCIIERSPNVERLFPNYPTVEAGSRDPRTLRLRCLSSDFAGTTAKRSLNRSINPGRKSLPAATLLISASLSSFTGRS